MSDAEKRAWWTAGVVAVTIAAYAIFLAFAGRGPTSVAVFALLALAALPELASRHFDERDREIANRAHLAGFRAFWLAFVGLTLAIGFTQGWGAVLTVPVWGLGEALLWAASFVLGVQAATTIVLYRVGFHA